MLTCDEGAAFTNAALTQEFAFGGKAIFTLKSLRTETHYTYKLKFSYNKYWFASVLSGESEYIFLGIISKDDRTKLIRTKASQLPVTDERHLALKYFLHSVIGKNTIPSTLEVWHVGKCGRCARPLTHPESIERGIGPECWNKLTN